MAKRGIEKNQHQIVVEYYCTKWGIEEDHILKIQMSDPSKGVSVLIETRGDNKPAINPKSKKKNQLVNEETRERTKTFKWQLLSFALELFDKLCSKFINRR